MIKKDVLIFERDKTGKLDRSFERMRKKHFHKLVHARINYVFRTTSKKDDEGMMVLGEARKLSNRERDLYGYDFEICIHKKSWEKGSKKRRRRIAWHELNHLIVKYKYGMDAPMIDQAGRLSIALKRHDIIIKTFEEELVMFGPMKSEMASIQKIVEYIKERREK